MRGALLIFAILGALTAEASQTPVEKLRATTLRTSIGTGSVVLGKSGRKYLLTNWHVCKSSTWRGVIFGSLPNGVQVKGKVVKVSPTDDLCAAIVDSQVPGLTLGSSLGKGQGVYTRGYPEGVLTESHGTTDSLIHWTYEFPIFEVGECPEKYKKSYSPYGNLVGCQYTFTSVLTDLYSRPGSSGSPVVDESGALVGVVSSWHGDKQSYDAGIVPYSAVKAFLETL